jgi:hypothetical protein
MKPSPTATQVAYHCRAKRFAAPTAPRERRAGNCQHGTRKFFLNADPIPRAMRAPSVGTMHERDWAIRRSIAASLETQMSISLLLTIVLVLLLIGALPAWPHSRRWGYGPSGALGVILLIIVVLMLTGRF